MPSWKIHKAVYERLLLKHRDSGFIVWTPGVLNKIDKIIDSPKKHDIGRPPDAKSLKELYKILWLEFGDVYDAWRGTFLKLKSKDERQKWFNYIINTINKPDYNNRNKQNMELEKRYLFYVPDDVFALALLHHILDLYAKCIYQKGVEPETCLRYVKETFESPSYIELLQMFKTGDVGWDKILNYLFEIFEEELGYIHELVLEYFKSKGLKPGYSLERLRVLMLMLVRKKNYYGIIRVNNRQLPVVSAASVAYSILKRGGKVTINVGLETINASTLEELFEKLERSLSG